MSKRRHSKRGVTVQTEFFGREVIRAVEEAATSPAGPLAKAAATVERVAKMLLRVGMSEATASGKRRYIPSDPGQPPHRRSNTLRNSITFAVMRSGLYRRLSAIVGPTAMAAYGKIHEFGGTRHPERPFMAPALEQARAKYPQYWRNLRLDKTPTGRRLAAKKYKDTPK